MISLDALLDEVNVLYQGNRYPEMIALLNDAILEDNAHPELYFYRGIAWSSTSKAYDKAINDFTKAITLKPDLYRAYQNRGITWALIKKYDKAVEDFAKVIALRPEYGSAYHHMGNALREKKTYVKAIPYYDRAVELKPGQAQVYLDRATNYYSLEEYDKAIEDCDTAIALEPDQATAYTDRGNALYKKAAYDLAMESYHRAIGIRPTSGRAYFGLGRVYEAVKEFDRASIHYKRAYYLGFDKARMIEVFREKSPAPYIVKEIVAGMADQNQELNFAVVAWLMAACKRWDGLLDHLQQSGYPETHPEAWYRLEAMVQYYMGNSIAAYRIFDTQFDSEAHPFPLTLRDQYYLVLSAADFSEPDNGLAYALEQARKEDGSDPVNTYYAGWLFLLSNEVDKALWCFNKCQDFLPALYGKIAVYDLQDNEAGLLLTAEKIAAAEAVADGGLRFLQGIRPLAMTTEMSFDEIYEEIMRLVHYYELTEEIAVVRRLLHIPSGFQHLEFTALPEWSRSVV
ncbi:tetratricopeptide repeat protein [Flavitalea sp. BT771]|uniref:tetratricopeptide repeat protein n=1 Tax=Flavitalea sp. BT771 TaxID=3063329 RepID=UPI0026E1DA3D|nr:tetratricopeptide repeat protein [Flavitalea sp. BT771]MDO6432898.1 tetratricopeptide repeat protein [Flavitalea sp. BT771]MDV6221826.1 tetratricopeptide repeat protein [Flavitalea sp. BT771]